MLFCNNTSVLGPTILEDEELLKSHANPILSELRKEKRKTSWSETEMDKLIQNISDMKRKLAEVKKKRYGLFVSLFISRYTYRHSDRTVYMYMYIATK